MDNYHNRVADSPLARPFWSQVPYAFGLGDTTICRYSVVPDPQNMAAPIPPQYRDKDYLRRAMVDQLTTAVAIFGAAGGVRFLRAAQDRCHA